MRGDFLEKTEKWIREKIPFPLPQTVVSMEVAKDGIILDGHTTITKVGNITKAVIVIHVSEPVLRMKNIEQGIKLVLIHEFCHVVNFKNPDTTMKVLFPEEWKIWEKAQRVKALECGVELIESK